MSTLALISHTLCPYVQRAAISLAEKHVPFKRHVVDLGNRPDWFNKMSPLGKVPLLKVDDDVVFESTVILEYLEETQAKPMHPADPLLRARHRSWMEFGSATLKAIGRFYSANGEEQFKQETTRLTELFERLEDELGDGPWFAGGDFSLVDAVYGPVFRYFNTFDLIGDFGILSNKPKIAAWRKHLAARPSVAAAVSADYGSELKCFLLRRESFLSVLIARKEVPVP